MSNRWASVWEEGVECLIGKLSWVTVWARWGSPAGHMEGVVNRMGGRRCSQLQEGEATRDRWNFEWEEAGGLKEIYSANSNVFLLTWEVSASAEGSTANRSQRDNFKSKAGIPRQIPPVWQRQSVESDVKGSMLCGFFSCLFRILPRALGSTIRSEHRSETVPQHRPAAEIQFSGPVPWVWDLWASGESPMQPAHQAEVFRASTWKVSKFKVFACLLTLPRLHF